MTASKCTFSFDPSWVFKAGGWQVVEMFLALERRAPSKSKLVLYSAICSGESALPVNALERWVGPGPTQETDTPGCFCQNQSALAPTK